MVVMGHIDHGKTALLDAVRKTNVVERESGGITQHIGAYQVRDAAGKTITFLDTPGHEAFSAIRARGAKVADLAVLVVAADEGVKPQTLEAAKHIAAAEIPFIVAINKVDKPEANSERVKKELSENGIQVEAWGGKVPSVEVSAKTGQGMPELLELISLVAEVEGIGAASLASAPTSGVVIEAKLDGQRGPVATLLVQTGALEIGDMVVAGNTYGAVRALTEAEGAAVRAAGPSTPVLALGLNAVAPLGEKFAVVSSRREAEERARLWQDSQGVREATDFELPQNEEGQTLLFIVKADVEGSREAIVASISSIAPEGGVSVVVLRSGVGNVAENDIKMAAADRARLVGFRVKVEPRAKALASQMRVPVETFDVIYNLIERVRELVLELVGAGVPTRTELGELTVLALFRKEASRQVVGGKVTQGVARRGSTVEALRGGEAVAEGRVAELQQNKAPVDEVAEGKECGLLIVGTNAIQPGDTLRFFEQP